MISLAPLYNLQRARDEIMNELTANFLLIFFSLMGGICEILDTLSQHRVGF